MQHHAKLILPVRKVKKRMSQISLPEFLAVDRQAARMLVSGPISGRGFPARQLLLPANFLKNDAGAT